MIMFFRSAKIAPGRANDAVAFAHRVNKYLDEKYGGKGAVALPIGGNPSRVGWSRQFANLAEFDTLTTKLLTDADYNKMVAEVSNFFIAGSLHDEIWRTI